jgi:hypothetical protein
VSHKLQDSGHGGRHLVVDGVDQAVGDLARSKAVAPPQDAQSIEPAAQRIAVEAVGLEFANATDLEVADPSVGTQDDLHPQARHGLVVIQQIGHAAVGLGGAEPAGEAVEAHQTGCRVAERLVHAGHHGAEGAEHVQPEPDRFQTGVVARGAQQMKEGRDLLVQTIQPCGEFLVLVEVAQNRLAKGDGLGVGRRRAQKAAQERPVDGNPAVPSREGQDVPDELIDKEVATEVFRTEGRLWDRQPADLGVEFAGAGPAEEGQIHLLEEEFGVRTGPSGFGSEEVRERQRVEFARRIPVPAGATG